MSYARTAILVSLLVVSAFPLLGRAGQEEKVIVLVGAMKEEVQPILGRLKVTRQYENENRSFWEGELGGHAVVLAQCGTGQENAQACASFLLNNYLVQALIFSGVGGSTELKIKPGDVVISEKILGDVLSPKPFSVYSPDGALGSMAQSNTFDFPLLKGTFYTTTSILVDEFALYPLLRQMDVQCVAMEDAALARTAEERDIPFLSIRGISDQLPLVGPLMLFQYSKHLDVAAEHAATVATALISDIK
jgi:nucleoside phosphorylase